MKASSLTLGTRQPNGTVVLDHAEAAFLHQLLESIAVAETHSLIHPRAWEDSRYVESIRDSDARALGYLVGSGAVPFHRVEEPNPDGVTAAQDYYRISTRLAVLKGGIPAWPGERELAAAWDANRAEKGHRPGGPAFRIPAHLLRGPDFTAGANRASDAAHDRNTVWRG
jgi:hypothetical protein